LQGSDGGMSYDDRLRMVGLTTLETRRLRADMIEVYTILRSFRVTDVVKFFQGGVGINPWDAQEVMIGNYFKSVLI